MRLSAWKRRIYGNAAAATALAELADFGNDPGNLRALIHIPDGLFAGSPLVVALYGCTQTAAQYDLGAGWSRLADRGRAESGSCRSQGS